MRNSNRPTNGIHLARHVDQCEKLPDPLPMDRVGIERPLHHLLVTTRLFRRGCCCLLNRGPRLVHGLPLVPGLRLVPGLGLQPPEGPLVAVRWLCTALLHYPAG